MTGVQTCALPIYVAFIFLSNERTTSYVWALTQLKDLFMECGVLPGVFVTDRELAAMNAIQFVFPEAAHLLCRRHISKDVQRFVTTHMATKKYERSVRIRWKRIVNARTEELYETAVQEMTEAWRNRPRIMAYVHTTWLDKYKCRFVTAWTKEILHFGTDTTNR